MDDQRLQLLLEKSRQLRKKISTRRTNALMYSSLSLAVAMLPFGGIKNPIVNTIFFGVVPLSFSAVATSLNSKNQEDLYDLRRIENHYLDLVEKRDAKVLEMAYEPQQQQETAYEPEMSDDELLARAFHTLLKDKAGIKVYIGPGELFDLYNTDSPTHIRYPCKFQNDASFEQVSAAIKKYTREIGAECGIDSPELVATLRGYYIIALNHLHGDFVRPDRVILGKESKAVLGEKKQAVVNTANLENSPRSFEKFSKPEISESNEHNTQVSFTIAKSESFPTEDVAQLMVNSTVGKDTARSIFVIAPSGTGKTALMQNALYKLYQATSGNCLSYIFAGKNTEQYCGLETLEGSYELDYEDNPIPQVYSYAGNDDNTPYAVALLRHIDKTYVAKNHGFPVLVLQDENNMFLKACSNYDSEHKGKESLGLYAKKVNKDYSIAVRGRTLNCCTWITAHTPRAEDIGQSTGIFANVSGIILGRTQHDGTPSYDLIYETLTGRNSNGIITNIALRERLLGEFNAYLKRLDDGVEDGSKVVCLTSVGGNWRLLMLPVYQKNALNIDLGLVKADDPHSEFDSEYQSKFGNQPEDEIWPASSPKFDSLDSLIEHLKAWVKDGKTEKDLIEYLVSIGQDDLLKFLPEIKKEIGME